MRLLQCALLSTILATAALPTSAQTTTEDPNEVYRVPESSREILGNISYLLQSATPVDKSQFVFPRAKFIGTLPGGELYFEVDSLEISDDGNANNSPDDWDPYPWNHGHGHFSHQNSTPYGQILSKRNGEVEDGISPFDVPYISLVSGRSQWFKQFGIMLGDGAVVIRGNTKINAVFADITSSQIADLSVRGHQLFDEKVFEKGFKAKRDASGHPVMSTERGNGVATLTRQSLTKGPYIIIVFPKSSAGDAFITVEDSLAPTIEERFSQLTGIAADSQTSPGPVPQLAGHIRKPGIPLNLRQRQLLQAESPRLISIKMRLQAKLKEDNDNLLQKRNDILTSAHELQARLATINATLNSFAGENDNGTLVMLEDFSRRCSTLIDQITSTSGALPSPSALMGISQPSVRLVGMQKSLTDRLLLPIRLSNLAVALTSLIDQTAKGLGRVADTGSDEFVISFESTPSDATVSFKRLGEDYMTLTRHTPILDMGFPFAMWTFKFEKDGCDTHVYNPNPYIESDLKLKVTLSCPK